MAAEKTDHKPVALVLGGTSGLGLALVRHLCQLGWQTIVVGRTIHDYEVGLGRYYLDCDLANKDDVARLIVTLEQQHRRLDAFFWITGTFLYGSVTTCSTYESQQLIDVNFTNPLPLVTSVWRRFQNVEQPTWLAAVSCSSATRVSSDQAVYAASLAARAHFVRCLGAENRNPRGRVALYAPGGMQTNLYNTSGRPDGYGQFLAPSLVATRLLDHLLQPNWGPHNVTVEIPCPSFAAEPIIFPLRCE